MTLELVHPMYLTRGALSSAVKEPDNKSNHLLHLVRTKNEWSYTSATPHPSCRKGTDLPLEGPKEVECKIKFFLRNNEFLNTWIEMTKDNVRPRSLYWHL
jgi:hypothetical protein